MGIFINVFNLLILLLPLFFVWVHFRKKRHEILAEPTENEIQKGHQDVSLKKWKNHYKSTFEKYAIGALIISNVLTIGVSYMDNKTQIIEKLESDLSKIKQGHGTRLKKIEDYLFPPGGPTGPTIFQRTDAVEKSFLDLKGLVLRLAEPDDMINRKIQELEAEIMLLKQELKVIKQGHVQVQTQGFTSS